MGRDRNFHARSGRYRASATEARKPMSDTIRFLVRDSADFITRAAGRYVGTDAVRNAAKRIGALETDENGLGVIPRSVVEVMARNYSQVGYLLRKGARE